MLEAIQDLLELQAIELVPRNQKGWGFLLNRVPGAQKEWGDMDSPGPQMAKSFFQETQVLHGDHHSGTGTGDQLALIVLLDNYIHVSIRPNHRCFLRFCYRGAHFNIESFLSAWKWAQVFTRLLIAPVAYLRLQGIDIFSYLDVILIKSMSKEQAQKYVHLVPLREVTCKVVWLVEVTSARWVSELGRGHCWLMLICVFFTKIGWFYDLPQHLCQR